MIPLNQRAWMSGKTIAGGCTMTQQTFRRFNRRQTFSDKLSIGEAAAILEDNISNISQVNDLKEFGTVLSIGDGIARIHGISEVQAGGTL